MVADLTQGFSHNRIILDTVEKSSIKESDTQSAKEGAEFSEA
jgi:hypothetical protein